MKKFMDEDFLLTNEVARHLYHEVAKDMPIFDYHCHLSPQEIAENKSYKNITEIWLGGDHYKWRAMRSFGIQEKYITGDGSDKEKFMAWASVIEGAIGNPLYHWSHLELKRYFGIDEPLTTENAEAIWDKTNALLQKDDFRARNLITNSNVKALCTTDDPLDDLKWHKQIASDSSFTVEVRPTFRPDKIVTINNKGYSSYLDSLARLTNLEINDFATLKAALMMRIDYFHEAGTRVSDHGLSEFLYEEFNDNEIDEIIRKAKCGQKISAKENAQYFTALMIFFGNEYHKRSWVMQYHIGALRNNNTKMFESIGPDTGFDSIDDFDFARAMSKVLDKINMKGLPKTVLYNLNPKDNYTLGTMIGNFQEGGVAGKMQFGSGWWFNDQRDGMVNQLKTLGNLGMLSTFVGMLTDSRSFLSYTRHEYFRRILCNLLGAWVEAGEYPADYKILEKIVADICYNNIDNYIEL